MNDCVICREELLIAVEMTCFRCYKKNQISCSSFSRVCRKCAHTYLQLDQPVEHRDMMKRCLYCPALCSTLHLSMETAYRKDYLLLRADASTNHRCPYCFQFQGTQLAIDQHLDSNCPDMIVPCACGATLSRTLWEQHFRFCSERKQCSLCFLFILQSEMEDHMIHTHHHMKCALCDDYVAYHAMTVHIMEECSSRMVHCEYCQAAIPFRTVSAHMEEHENEFHTTFLRLMRNITTALREYNQFRRARNRRLSD